MFVMFNVLFVIHYYLFVIFFFVLLKYLFPVVETNYLVLKNIIKKYHVNIGKCGHILKILS